MSNRLQVVEICAGAGGQALGLCRAGFAHRVAVEYDGDAADTLDGNLSRVDPVADTDARVIVGDVTDSAVLTPEAFVGVDLLAGAHPARRSPTLAANSARPTNVICMPGPSGSSAGSGRRRSCWRT